MIVKVIGIERQKYTLENGYSFSGRKLHCADMTTQKESIDGNLTTTIKLADDSKLGNMQVDVGEYYQCYFTQKGALDFFSPCEEPIL